MAFTFPPALTDWDCRFLDAIVLNYSDGRRQRELVAIPDSSGRIHICEHNGIGYECPKELYQHRHMLGSVNSIAQYGALLPGPKHQDVKMVIRRRNRDGVTVVRVFFNSRDEGMSSGPFKMRQLDLDGLPAEL